MFVPLHAEFGFDPTVLSGIQDPEQTGETSTLPALEQLATLKLLGLGVGGGDGLGTQVAVISALAQQSLSVAFSVWAHRMVIEYVSESGANRGLVLALEDADVVGSTAMAPALRASLGLDRVGLTATKDGHGYRVAGVIPWASNLHVRRTVVVAAAERPDESHVVIVFAVSGDKVYPASTPRLLALQATASGRLVVDDVKVGPTQVLSDDLDGFLTGVRPIFMLLQAAFAIGLGESALAALDGSFVGADAVLNEDRDRLLAQHDRLISHTLEAANGSSVTARDVIAYRLEASEFAQAAVAAEAKRAGGRGYVATSGTARRIREAAFLPIQSPTESQLRWELSCSA